MLQHFLTSVPFQFSLLLFIALLGYLIAALTKQSAIVGQILAGIIIGPSALGLITYTGLVSHFAHLGAVILLFVVGLEFKLKEIVAFKQGVVAFAGVVVPWVMGFIVAQFFGYDHATAIFIGTALTATSIAITANILHELGKLHSDVAKTIIGAAIIDDVLALIALTLSVNLLDNVLSFSIVTMLLIKAAAFLIIGLAAGYYVFARIIYWIDNSIIADRCPEFIFIFAISIAFLYAMIAEAIGLSAIVGAFIAGVFLEGVSLKNSTHFKDGANFLRIIFASIFFISLGVLVDLTQISYEMITFILVLALVAIMSKFLACSVPAKLFGMSWRDSLAVGIGMSPRGEVAMIVALLGLNHQIIGQSIYVSIIMMSLITTVFVPFILRALLKDNGAVRQYPL